MEKGGDAPLEKGMGGEKKQCMNTERLATGNSSSMSSIRGDEESRIGEEITTAEKVPSLSRTATGPGQESMLAKTITLVRTRETEDPGPPPDGGLVAWSQAAIGHLVILNTWGYINSFGVFQAYYSEALDQPHSNISWVGSIQIFLLFFIGTFSGRATDAGFFKVTWGAGCVINLLGIFMTSLSKTYWQLFLAQGLCQGIGCGLMFCPTLALLATYFSKNRGFAIGVGASGSATGGLIFPAVVERLLPQIGFPWTMRVLGFITLATQIPAILWLKQRLPPRKSGPILELAAFKELPYLLFSIGMFLNFLGLYVAFFYISSFARDIIGLSRSTAINLLLIMNGSGMLGRLLPNYLADQYLGPLNLLIPFAFVSGVVLFGWTGVHDIDGLYAFAVIYGLSAAGVQSLFPATLSSLTTDLKKTGVRMGMVMSIVGCSSLMGSPIAGALIDSKNGDYLYAQIFAGVVMFAGSMILVAARVIKAGYGLTKV
ncbi:hypothetical protein FQN54_004287 [Arachnomyces sp. PD_36]|nr:hypothetical protein FQN54_004287 [Arachnomyces sp. PD_36]